MTTLQTVRCGDTGTIIHKRATKIETDPADPNYKQVVPIDISGATLLEVHFHGQNNESSVLVGSLTGDGTDGWYNVTTVATTWPDGSSGIWKEQGRIVLPTGDWIGQEEQRTVQERILSGQLVGSETITISQGESRDGIIAAVFQWQTHSTVDITAGGGGSATLEFFEKYCDGASKGTVAGVISLLTSDLYSVSFSVPVAIADALEAGTRTTYRAVVNHGVSEKVLGFGSVTVK